MGPLPIRTDLRLGETPASYGARIAFLNGTLLTDFCGNFGIDLIGLANGDFHPLSQLAMLGGVEANEMRRFSVCRLENKQYRIGGQLVETRWILRSTIRFCPQCITEDLADHGEDGGPVGKAYWHMAFLRDCGKHHIPLMDLAPERDWGLQHDFTSRILRNRFDIQDEATVAQSIRPSDLGRYIEARVVGKAFGGWLDGLELNAATYFCEMLGVLFEFGSDCKVQSLSRVQRNRAGHTGFKIAKQGPERICNALREDLPTPGLLEMAQGHLGPLYHWLNRSARQPEYQPVKDMIRDYILNNFPIGAGEIVLGEEVRTRRVHSLSTFQKDCNMSGYRVRAALVEHGFLSLDAETGFVNEPGIFSAPKSEPLMQQLNDGLTRLATSKKLNIPRGQFDAVCEAGLIQPIRGLGDITPHYSLKVADKLFSQMMRDAVPIEHFVQEMVDIPTACRKLVCGAAEIIQLLKDRKIRSLGKIENEHGYMSLRIDVSEVGPLLGGVGVTGYTKADLKYLLGVNDPAIKYLIEAEYILASKARNPRTRKVASVVEQHNLDLFLIKYAPVNELAALFNLHARTIITKLGKLGINKVEMPRGGVGSIYLREQALTALHQN